MIALGGATPWGDECSLIQLRLVDMNGRAMVQYRQSELPEGQMTIDVNALPVGLYLLETVSLEGERQTQWIQIGR